MAGEFVKLFRQKQDYVDTIKNFDSMVQKSFRDDKSRATQDEVRRRVTILLDGFKMMRSDLGWGLDRIMAELPTYLRCKLDHANWEANTRTLWMPEDGRL